MGRGFVQLTHYENYLKSMEELGLSGADDLVQFPERALNPAIAADIMFSGMAEGWFRGDKGGRQTLLRYFDEDTNDPYTAREIINGDKHIVPKWSNGVSIGNLIKGYHEDFLAALVASYVEPPAAELPPVTSDQVIVDITIPENVNVVVRINGKPAW